MRRFSLSMCCTPLHCCFYVFLGWGFLRLRSTSAPLVWFSFIPDRYRIAWSGVFTCSRTLISVFTPKTRFKEVSDPWNQCYAISLIAYTASFWQLPG